MQIKNDSQTKNIDFKDFFKPDGTQRLIFDERVLINSQKKTVFVLVLGQM